MTSENPSYTAHFEFWCSLDLDGIEEDLFDQPNCPNCHEPFNTKIWEFGKRVEYRVRRSCGHYVGLKCVTRMEELGQKECPKCLSRLSDSVMPWTKFLKEMKPDDFRELSITDMAIQNAISTVRVLRGLGRPVDWSKIFMQVYETSFVSYEREDNGLPAVDTPDYVFFLPLLMLEAALRAKGFFELDCDMPNVPQLQQDLDNLKKRLDSRLALPKEWYMPEIKVMMSKADLRRTAFVTAVNELNAEKGEIGWTKHQQGSLRQDIQWSLWQKINLSMILLLIFLAGLQLFLLVATWGVLTEKK